MNTDFHKENKYKTKNNSLLICANPHFIRSVAMSVVMKLEEYNELMNIIGKL